MNGAKVRRKRSFERAALLAFVWSTAAALAYTFSYSLWTFGALLKVAPSGTGLTLLISPIVPVTIQITVAAVILMGAMKLFLYFGRFFGNRKEAYFTLLLAFAWFVATALFRITPEGDGPAGFARVLTLGWLYNAAWYATLSGTVAIGFLLDRDGGADPRRAIALDASDPAQ